MLIDRNTKIILLLVASGLWANALGTIVKSTPAKAGDPDPWIMSIDANITKIARGTCLNNKLC